MRLFQPFSKYLTSVISGALDFSSAIPPNYMGLVSQNVIIQIPRRAFEASLSSPVVLF